VKQKRAQNEVFLAVVFGFRFAPRRVPVRSAWEAPVPSSTKSFEDGAQEPESKAVIRIENHRFLMRQSRQTALGRKWEEKGNAWARRRSAGETPQFRRRTAQRIQ
jgi:hypothetical protein